MRASLLILVFLIACGDDTASDAGADASDAPDAGRDTSIDSPSDVPNDSFDTGTDANPDANPDAGFDANRPDTSVPCRGEGEACREPIIGEWSPCRYADECVTTGERSRTTTVFTCREGFCRSEFVVETEPSDCVRNTDNDPCMGGDEMRCCDGACRNTFMDDMHCGACGQVCGPFLNCTNVVFAGVVSGTCIGCVMPADCGEGSWQCRGATGPDHCSCLDDETCGPLGQCGANGYCAPL